MIDFKAKPLFILEMANNHMGDVNHGIRILREFREVTKDFDFNFAFKLQHRDTSFFHPEYRGRTDFKYIKRFTETKLSKEQFKMLQDEMKKLGYISMCSPWDEQSVDLMEELGFEIIKIASCSFTDWPLLERVAKSNLPIIASTAGATLKEIDKVVAFFEHRNKNFCLMHCIAAYPTQKEQLQLNQIDLLKNRYLKVTIGYSTHESPDNLDAVKIVVGKGVTVFERHVGVPTSEYKLNDYSSTPSQIKKWLIAAKEAYDMCGMENIRIKITEKEKMDLIPLYRGVFAKRRIKSGEKIDLNNTFLAMPNVPAQLLSRDMSKYSEFTAKTDIENDKPIMKNDITIKDLREKVHKIITSLKDMLRKSKTYLPNQIDMEISSHYGIDRFDEWGAVLIKVVNREYCKILLVMFPGQNYPMHYHKLKEESLHLLYGDLTINLENKKELLRKGDLITIERALNHSFATKSGAIIEEISTTYVKGDSYYEDKTINDNKDRKFELTYWVND
jgi:sialic acid synthase SpsE/quercetin dioxygenase-like cupin family protein